MIKLIGNLRGKKLIDCGCGFGGYSIYFARQGAIVTAIDISETMIQLARGEADRASVEIDFRVQDATDLDDFPPETFDIAISTNAICFDMPLFLKQAARVLKPKGALCLSDVHPIMSMKYGNYLDRGIRKAKNVFGKLSSSDPDYEWQWEHYTLEDYSAALKDAGFIIESMLEPKPAPVASSVNPKLYDRARRNPIFILIRAVKIKGVA